MGSIIYNPGGSAAESTTAIVATSYGAIGNGTADDTTALQNAINAAVSAKKPLYLPPGEYKTTAELKAESRYFSMFGAGAQWSIIKPNAANFNGLKIGPGAEGSGNDPSGYCRDFQVAGGSAAQAERTKTGIASTTGKAAIVLDGWRLSEWTNVLVSGNWDIGFDMINNCFGGTFRNCSTSFNSCRVGLNLRKGAQSGSDICFEDCWIRGEVAAVYVSGGGGGYRFKGGQMSSNNAGTEVEDGRGTLTLGREYVAGEVVSGANNVTLFGVDFEGMAKCWLIRGYSSTTFSATDVAFNANGGGGASIGYYKNSAHGNSKVTLMNCSFLGTVSNAATETWKQEGTGGSQSHTEFNSSGTFTANSVSTPMDVKGICTVNKFNRCHGGNAYNFWHHDTMLQTENGTVTVSTDWGTTYKPLMAAREEELASAATISPKPETTLLKISGTQEITKITPTKAGHVLAITFLSTAKLKKGSTASENCKLTATLEPTADDSFLAVCDGTFFKQLSPLQAL